MDSSEKSEGREVDEPSANARNNVEKCGDKCGSNKVRWSMDETQWLFWSSQELQILYHDRVSLIVSRFSVFIKKCVIRCCHVTESFCAKWSFARALPARSSRNLGFLLQTSQFRSLGMWIKILCLPDVTSLGSSEFESREMFADATNSASSRLSVNSNHSRRSRKRLSAACWLSQFGYFLGFLERSRRLPDASSSLRRLAGLEQVLTESCGNEVEDELAPELDDNPGTTRDSTFSVLHSMLFPLIRCGFWSLAHS